MNGQNNGYSNGHSPNGVNGHGNGVNGGNGHIVEDGVRPGYYSVGANPPPAWSNCKKIYFIKRDCYEIITPAYPFIYLPFINW